ncbi:MAG: hypothetical protein FJ125_03715, partial [Deltaproteobacteria bacterium]|nr:hypothetical protein [Deltaproteobacteria bacterium]
MIRHSLQCLLALTVWTPYILLTPGCADESAGPATAEGEGEGEGEGSPGIPQCNEGEYCASLEAVEPATVVFGAVQMEQRKIKIRYLKPDPSNPGQQLPIAMAPILWSIEVPGVPMPGAQLGSGSTQTDDQGFSENTVHTGTGEGQLRVTVKAPVAQDLVYTVNVGTKEQGTIEVRVEYPPGGVFVGDNRFTEVMVYAFEHKAGPVACAGLDPSNITGGGTPSWSVPIGLPLPGSASRSFLLKGSRWTLIAIARKAFPETTPVAVASACNEQSGLVTGGQTTKVTLQLTDLRFPYKGRYKAHTFINFMKMLPGDPESCSIFSGDDCGSIEGIVTQVADFFSDPGRFVLVVLEDVIEQQFDIGVPDGFKNVLARLLNSALERLLPGWAQGIFTVGGDLALILQELEVIEYFIFTEEPTPSTSDARLLVFPACAEGQQNCAQWEEWTDICFNWRLGRCEGIDPNDMASGCGRQCFALNDFVAPLDGQPVPSVEGGFNAPV